MGRVHRRWPLPRSADLRAIHWLRATRERQASGEHQWPALRKTGDRASSPQLRSADPDFGGFVLLRHSAQGGVSDREVRPASAGDGGPGLTRTARSGAGHEWIVSSRVLSAAVMSRCVRPSTARFATRTSVMCACHAASASGSGRLVSIALRSSAAAWSARSRTSSTGIEVRPPTDPSRWATGPRSTYGATGAHTGEARACLSEAVVSVLPCPNRGDVGRKRSHPGEPTRPVG
jgi:hypothetical protein